MLRKRTRESRAGFVQWDNAPPWRSNPCNINLKHSVRDGCSQQATPYSLWSQVDPSSPQSLNFYSVCYSDLPQIQFPRKSSSNQAVFSSLGHLREVLSPSVTLNLTARLHTEDEKGKALLSHAACFFPPALSTPYLPFPQTPQIPYTTGPTMASNPSTEEMEKEEGAGQKFSSSSSGPQRTSQRP